MVYQNGEIGQIFYFVTIYFYVTIILYSGEESKHGYCHFSFLLILKQNSTEVIELPETNYWNFSLISFWEQVYVGRPRIMQSVIYGGQTT